MQVTTLSPSPPAIGSQQHVLYELMGWSKCTYLCMQFSQCLCRTPLVLEGLSSFHPTHCLGLVELSFHICWTGLCNVCDVAMYSFAAVTWMAWTAFVRRTMCPPSRTSSASECPPQASSSTLLAYTASSSGGEGCGICTSRCVMVYGIYRKLLFLY